MENNEKINDGSNDEKGENLGKLSKTLAATKLNVDAPVFVPSFSINQNTSSETSNSTSKKSDDNNKNNEEVADDWEANADDDEDGEDVDEGEGIL